MLRSGLLVSGKEGEPITERGAQPVNPSALLVATTPTHYLVGVLVLDAVAWLVIFVALVRIVVTPASLWAHGRLSKTAWIVGTLWFTWNNHGVIWPIGAIAALWQTWHLARRRTPDPTGLPYADGTLPATDNPEEP
jgi:hypothetical protein